jgi:hypothetical protein
MKALTQGLTQVEMTDTEIEHATTIAQHLGYTQTAYTSTSDLWGVFCLPENPARPWVSDRAARRPPYRPGCVIKTRELGYLFVQDIEDLGLPAAEGGAR